MGARSSPVPESPAASDRDVRWLILALLLSVLILGLWESHDALFGGEEADLRRFGRGALSSVAVVVVVLLLGVRAHRRRDRLLQRAKEHLEGLMRSTPEAIVTTDLRGRFTYVSESAGVLLETPPDELVGHPAAEVYVRGRTEALELLRDLAEGKGAARREVDLRKSDGSAVAVDLSVSILRDAGGNRVGTLGHARPKPSPGAEPDPCEELADLVALRELSTAVAHEVRNPLAGIRGALRVLMGQHDRSPRESAVMGEILEQIHRLEDMVSDLTAFAQPSVVRPRPENVSNLVDRATATVALSPTMAGVELDVSVEGSLTALADEEQFIRALTIVLENAVHAAAGQGAVRVSAAREERGVVVTVEDTGPGVPEERREDVFRAFYTTKHRGSGLGLAIARRILEAHGGTIELEPSGGEGVGARFAMRLPAVPGRGAARSPARPA